MWNMPSKQQLRVQLLCELQLCPGWGNGCHLPTTGTGTQTVRVQKPGDAFFQGVQFPEQHQTISKARKSGHLLQEHPQGFTQDVSVATKLTSSEIISF